MTTTTTLTTVGSKTSWTAEDFERYGAKLVAEAEKKKAAEKAKEEKKFEEKRNESKPLVLSLETLDSFGFSPDVKLRFAAAYERNKLRVEKEGERVRKKYGDISDNEVLTVLKAEEEKAECANCKGLPCKKAENKCSVPKLVKAKKYGGLSQELELKINHENCGYEKMRRLNKKYKLAQIPLEYQGKTFEDYKIDKDNETAVKAAQKLIEMPDKGVYFYGNVGTGKTYLAAIIAQEALKNGREVIFATVPAISMQLRSTFKNNSELTEFDILDKLCKVPMLILDDVGMEKPTRFICSTLCNVFNERYNARLQTIMTSNYTLKQLEYIFNNPTDSREPTLDGTRMYDRCKQMCIPIELKGESRR